MKNNTLQRIWAEEYVLALQENYPDLQWTKEYAHVLNTLSFDRGEDLRYQKPTERKRAEVSGWSPNFFVPRTSVNISRTYKGLLCHKSPIDQWLYTAIIHELQPKTIIELGSFHGGSGLWLADQLEAMQVDGEVHSFDLLSKAVSPRAKHEKLHFHQADLKDFSSFDIDFLKSLPRPWLIVEDAHVNVLNTLSFFRALMKAGDYFIKEDTCMLGTAAEHLEYLRLAESMDLYVDRIYADAFGNNVTTAENTWFVLPTDKPYAHPETSFRDITWEGAA